MFLKASRDAKIEKLKELFKRGANIEAKDNNGYTPLILGIFLNY